MTTLFLALPLWRHLIRNRITPHNEIPCVMGEEHIVYLDQDNILLPTIPPPAYTVDDPNSISTRARRPVAVLAVIESVEHTEDDGEGNIRRTTLRAVREGDERRVSITLKRRRRELEVSLKAVLSVIIFLLAIVGIAWLGSVAVAYTWPPKGTSPKHFLKQDELSVKIERLADDAVKKLFRTEDVNWLLGVRRRIPAHTTLDEAQQREVAMKSMEQRNGELIASLASYSSVSEASKVAAESSSSAAFERNAGGWAAWSSSSAASASAASVSSLSATTPLPSSILEPSVLQKLQAEIGN